MLTRGEPLASTSETSRNRESGGVGLGLTIARDVIHAHGGSIQLEPNQPCGLRVRVRLPKPGSTPDRPRSASPARERPQGAGSRA
jgi:signal transduction histidine kinase